MQEWIKNLYWELQPIRLLERVIGTKAREIEWANKNFHKGHDWCGSEHKHRDLLCNVIASYKPDSVLELGCNEGQNLFRLAEMLPSSKFIGVDINEQALIKAEKKQSYDNFINVSFVLDSLVNIGDYIKSNSFDVVFTDATLIYIGKDKIDYLFEVLTLIARKAIVLCEWQEHGNNNLGRYYRGGWIRDYVSQCVLHDIKDYKITKITKDIWNDKIWSKYGAIIEIKL